MDYDLIVVGGGAGGLMTAYEAAKAGLQVVVVEKKEHLNKNIRFNSSILHSYPGINGEWISLRKGDGTTQLHFHRLNFSVPYTGSYVEFYDSYSKWPKIFEANKNVIKDPNRIKPGIVLQIPVE